MTDTTTRQYTDLQIAGYRAMPWTASRWAASGMPTRFGAHDAWPHVVQPLLAAAGATR